jgi:hypothetical protein
LANLISIRAKVVDVLSDLDELLAPPVPVDCVLDDPVWTNDGPEITKSDGSVWQPQIGTFTVLTPAQGDGLPCDLTPATREVLVQAAPAPEEPDPELIVFTKIGDSADRGQTITGTPGLPSLLFLHGTGTNLPTWGDLWEYEYPDQFVNYPGIPIKGQFTVEEANGLIKIRPQDHIVNPRNGVKTPMWWIGIHENGVANRFVERRLDAIVQHCVAHYQLDPARMACQGSSLGGRGTLTYGLRRNFSALNPILPNWNHKRIADLESGSLVRQYPDPVVMPDGSDYYPTIDMLAFIADPANKVPFLAWAIGRNDGAAPWSEQLEAVRLLKATRRAFCFGWNDGDHSAGAQPNWLIEADYPWREFSTEESHPAFFNSSIDQDPAVDATGYINIGFKWRNVVDTAGSWSCEVTNTRAASDMTVDLLPYNCQAFTESVGLKNVVIPLGQWVTVEFTAESAPGPGPEPEPEPEPQPDIAPVIHQTAVNLSRLVVFDDYHLSSRYERFQRLRVVSLANPKLKFHATDLAAGGTILPLLASSYTLIVDGVPLATCEVPAGASSGEFHPDWSGVTDGWRRVSIQVAAGESCPEWFVYVSKLGGPVSAWLEMPVVTGSYDIAHLHIPHTWAMLPARFTPTPKPLAPRETPAFSEALPRQQLHRQNIVPMRGESIYRPNVTATGLMTTANFQSYHWSNLIDAEPKLMLLDGPRGEGTVMMPTHIQPRRHGGFWFLDPWRFGEVKADGTVETLIGRCHRKPASQWDGPQDMELKGDWSRVAGPHELGEGWGFAWIPETLPLDMTAPLIGGEPPHVTNPIVLIADGRHGRFLMGEFNGRDRSVPAIVTELVTGLNDAWDIVCPPGGKAYGSERQSHRIIEIDVATGEVLRAIVDGGPTAATVGTVGLDRVARVTSLDAARALPCCAPEGLAYRDGCIEFVSKAQAEHRKVNIATEELQVVRPIAIDGNSRFAKLALSDGTFGPLGTAFYFTWSNAKFGMPEAYLPDGTKWAFYTSGSASIGEGKGGAWEAMGYASTGGVGFGMLICGTSQEGAAKFSQALPTDPTIDVARYVRGRALYAELGFQAVYGDAGFGYQGLPLPFGVDPDIDYFLNCHGHAA